MEAPHRFRSLDAWRGGLALVVAASHFNSSGWITNAPLVERAGLYVDFFFVLSGFVIAFAWRERLQSGEAARFLLRRVGRLWPLHAAVLLACVILAQLGAAVGLSVRGWDHDALPFQLTLTHSWGFLDRLGWNLPSWSISTEMFAYLVFGLVAFAAPRRALEIACAAILLLGLAVILFVAPGGMGSIYDYGVFRCLYGFMAGVLAESAWRRLGWRPRGELPALAAVFAAVLWLPDAATPLVVPLFAWVVLVFAGDAGPVSAFLQRPLPQLLGQLSYSIYMIHYVVALCLMAGLMWLGHTQEIEGNATFVAPLWATEAMTLFYLLTVVLVSGLTYRWIELPGQRLFRLRPRRVPADW